ncbi:hypothetical protein pipiens_000945, partial [Culex pipiens pipiens]
MSYGRLLWTDQLKLDFSQGCPVCRVSFSTEEALRNHMQKQHGRDFDVMLDVTDRRIVRNTMRLTVKYLARASRMIIRVENYSEVVLILRAVYLFGLDQRLEPTFDGVLRMVPGYSYEIEHTVKQCIPNYQYTMILSATVAGSQVELIEQYYVQMLKSTPMAGNQLKMGILPYHHIPQYLIDLYLKEFEHDNHYDRLAMLCLENLRKFNKAGLTPTNYVEHLRLLNMIEDYDLQTTFATYTIPKVTLKPMEQARRYLITLDQFDVPPNLLEEDGYARITVTKHNRNVDNNLEFINGYIDAVNETGIVVTMQAPVRFTLPCRVEFPLNRTQYKLEYEALAHISKIDLDQLLFPKVLAKKRRPVRQVKFDWFQPTIAANAEQVTAIRNIVNMTSYPAPYIIFGPPGTGKTSTIVEAVLQIWRQQPRAHVLVAASSNFACNELTQRLMRFVPEADIFRFFSRSCERNIETIDMEILEISNLATGIYEIPTYEHIYGSRIVVSTVTNCGRLAQAHVIPTFFDYIFIDECGSAKEISALVPIAGVGTEGSKIHASVILAGDPKQLGPVVRFEFLKKTVHNTSLLERLMAQGIYKRDPNTGEFNSLVITKLLDNYRSHKSLIHFSNEWFYEGELRARAASELTDWAINWNCLPNMAFPIIFHSVVGITRVDKQSCSSFNKEEAQKVLFYVQKMLTDGINERQIREQDIGIVSPYRRQVSFLRQGCRNYGWEEIEVGSAEQFQGREKPVIIVSTVRSQRKHVGFLANTRRLNVVITRARCLLIIIGNPDTLQNDPHWYRLLRYIYENNGVRGIDFVLRKPEVNIAAREEEEDFA